VPIDRDRGTLRICITVCVDDWGLQVVAWRARRALPVAGQLVVAALTAGAGPVPNIGIRTAGDLG